MSVFATLLFSAILAAPASDPVIILTPRPVEVAETNQPQLRLDGTWQFYPDAEGMLADPPATQGGWNPIDVPGHWNTQGFDVPENTAAAYRRTFSIPQDWAGRRIKLRFDGVYSDARVLVNGQEMGRHVGGFTPFEFDITGTARLGEENVLALAVKRESPADMQMTTFGTAYAKTPLGGITRKVTLFAVPAVHIQHVHLHTAFEAGYGDAQLHLNVAVVNEGGQPREGIRVPLALSGPNGEEVALNPGSIEFGTLAPGQVVTRTIAIDIASPAKWDSEHPNLYTLTCRVGEEGESQAVVRRRFGFRQVEVRGKQLFVNGRPVKLRGVCRHEMDAATGRVNSPAQSLRDVEVFRDANINLIRTSHYPPAEELLDACDELGMFVELESPFHHAKPILTPEYQALTLQQTAEVIERARNRACVIIWSLGNKASWSPNFTASAHMVRRLDPTRPRLFAETPGFFKQNQKDPVYRSLEIATWHYPGMNTIDEQLARTTRPMLFDEYCHGNCYNREEAATDPGLRDEWGLCLEEIWERMEASEACLGGAMWGGIDEVWHFADGRERGWGRWGLLDSWHREKPEYWHAKKVYSPIQAALKHLPQPGSKKPFDLVVENRHDFTNLNELRMEWTMGKQSGRLAGDAAPGETVTLAIQPQNPPKAGDTLRVEFHSPRGFLINVYEWPVATEAPQPAKSAAKPEALRLTEDGQRIIAGNSLWSWTFDRRTGMLLSGRVDGREVLCGGPTLMLLLIGINTRNQTHRENLKPWTAACGGWKAESVGAAEKDGAVEIHVEGAYQEAQGSYRIQLDGSGKMEVAYRFTAGKKAQVRQIGVVLDLPKSHDRLSWQRDTRWTVYPEDHIGRPEGTARARRAKRWPAVKPGQRPTWPWVMDETALGTNDFRATRTGIHRAALTDESGCGLSIQSDGNQAVRAWIEGERIRLLVAGFSRGSGEDFLCKRGFSAAKPLTLEPGQVVEGTIHGSLAGPGDTSVSWVKQ